MGSTFQWPAGAVSPRSSPQQTIDGTLPAHLFRLSEVFEEAYSRCGLELREAWHIVEGERSLRLLFQEWSNRGINLWTIVHEEASLGAGEPVVEMPPDTIDVMNAFIRESPGTVGQQDYWLRRLSTDEYDRIPQKRQVERPYQYWMNRAPRFPKLVLWPVPEEDRTLYYTRLRMLRSPGAGFSGEIDAPDRMLPALVAGLAYLTAQKNKECFPLVAGLKQEYDQQFLYSQMEDREKSDLRMTPMTYWP